MPSDRKESERKIKLLPDPIRERYLAKFGLVVLIVLVAVAAAGVYFQGQVSAELTDDVHAEMETVAELEADALHEWVTENEQNARMLSEFDAVKSGDGAAIDTQLDHELEQLPETTQAIHYVDLQSGTVEQSTSEGMEGTDLETLDLRWADGSLSFDGSSEVAVSEVYIREERELVAFVSPVKGTSKAVMIAVDAEERADHFRNPIEGGYTQVVDSDGRIQFAENESQTLTAYREGEESRVLQAARRGAGATEREETDEVVAYAPVEGTDWVILAHAPQSNAYTLRSTVTTDFVALIGIALLGFVLIGATIGRNTVTALDRLTDNATAIARGQLDVDIEESERDDEIGELTEAFRSMQEYLATAADQAEAVADQRFDAPVLDREVPGTFGETIDRMGRDIEQAQEELEGLNSSLEAKADEYRAVMESAAAGDLSQRMDPESRNDSMTEIAEAFNGMMDELEVTITRIREFADEVSTSSQEVTSGTEEVASASEQVSKSIQEISAGAEQQSQQLREVADEMQNLSGTVEEVAASANDVASTAGTAAESGTAGKQSAAEAIEVMNAIETKADETVEEVESLAAEIEEIGEIVEMITDIAEQTNLLALNASIEAARAGEAGEGFAVVADEIKGLAGDAADATEEIETLIADIQTSTTDTVEDMQEMGDRVASGTETVEDALTALDEIADNVAEANTGIQEISDAADDQAASTEEVVSMVDEVSGVAEQASAEAENVSAAAEEQTSSLNEVSENIEALALRAEELRDLLDEFTVDDSGASVEDGAAVGADATTQATADGGQSEAVDAEELSR